MKEMLIGNYRLTRQRRIILDAVRSLRTHPTADEIYTLVRQQLPSISLGTVYRNLEMMSRSGLIVKLESLGAQKRYDGCISDHFHLKCTACGAIVDIPELRLEIMKLISKIETEVRIAGYHIEFTGLCFKCNQPNQ